MSRRFRRIGFFGGWSRLKPVNRLDIRQKEQAQREKRDAKPGMDKGIESAPRIRDKHWGRGNFRASTHTARERQKIWIIGNEELGIAGGEYGGIWWILSGEFKGNSRLGDKNWGGILFGWVFLQRGIEPLHRKGPLGDRPPPPYGSHSGNISDIKYQISDLLNWMAHSSGD